MQQPNAFRFRKSLANAVSRNSTANYPAILQGFAAMGISPETVFPRENVFTFNAWVALGRRVRQGEQAVVVQTYVRCRGNAGGAQVAGRVRPVSTQLYHITQTEPIPQGASAGHALN